MSSQYQRQEVIWFADEMERVLRQNDHKGGWKDSAKWQLLRRLREEVDELADLIETPSKLPTKAVVLSVLNNAIVKEAVDVANFAMMIASNAAEGNRP